MKILHITYGFNGGGVGFVIANYCTKRPFENIQFDIVGESIGKNHMLHERFDKAGFHVFYVTPKKQNLLKNAKEIYKLLKENRYDGVHVHFEEWSFLYLGLAKLCGVPIRIAHAHMAYVPFVAKKPHYKLFKVLLNRWATARLACSVDAGEALFKGHPYEVLHNAIDVSQYTFNPETRNSVRSQLGLEDRFVVGTVGRLSYQKNPLMTVRIFNEVYRRDQSAVLLMVGQGEMADEVKEEITKLHLQNAVRLMGLRSDVPDLMQAMDVFLLPSRYEGLGIVYVEAQAAGLHAIGTDVVVPKEACVSKEYMTFIPLEANEEIWATHVLKYKKVSRGDTSAFIAQSGYSLDNEVGVLRKFYNNQMDGK